MAITEALLHPSSIFRANRGTESTRPADTATRREEIVIRDIVGFLSQPVGHGETMELPAEPYPQTDSSLATDKNPGIPPNEIAKYFGSQIAEIVTTPTDSLSPSGDIYHSEPTQTSPQDIAKGD